MKKNKPSKLPVKPAPKPVSKPPKSNFFLNFGKQLLVAALGLFLLVQAKKNVDSYAWMYDSLLKGNMETIRKYPKATVDERYQMKIGFPIAYLNHIKQNTPDSAIIFFPAHHVFLDTKNPNQNLSGMGEWGFTKYAYHRFLYPRKVVLEREKDVSLFFEKVTHVAIVNGWGYDYLSYPVPVEYRANNTILPITQQQQ